MTPVVIAFGSNVGDSLGYIRQSISLLRADLAIERMSHVYRSAPMYVTNQAPFLNGVFTARTELGPRGLLEMLKQAEVEIGRRARDRYGPREIDLDLIAYGSLSYSYTAGEKALTIPHPKIVERRFVLLPLSEISPDFNLPGLGLASELLEQTNDQAADVERLDHAKL
jgi:2-amino-4-hydroxy-6-hydroxymethyldihydropteridine diphosphokinase